jgi:sugar phosphate isomerase/epimerase
VASAIHEAGFSVTQLNLSALGRPSLDRSLSESEAAAIGTDFREAGVEIWGLSGTFNAIHPDPAVRRTGVEGCLAVIARAPAVGAEVVTLSTGTRDADDTWRAHAGNHAPDAWRDLRATLDELIDAAATAGVRLGIEPEPGNVVSDAETATRLLAELGAAARHVAIVLDPANLLTVGSLPRQEAVLVHAFESLADHVVALHAKDVVAAGYAAPGVGGMDYGLVMRLHADLPVPVPIIAQDLRPDDARRVHDFLADHLAESHRR